MQGMVKHDIRRQEALAQIRHKCKCGHSVYISNRVDFVYCDYCFRRVYKNDFIEFKHKLYESCGKRINEQISQ